MLTLSNMIPLMDQPILAAGTVPQGKDRPLEGEQAILRTDHATMCGITYLEWLLAHLKEDRSML
jgi:hypothetical protein